MNQPKKRDNWNMVAQFFGLGSSEPAPVEMVEPVAPPAAPPPPPPVAETPTPPPRPAVEAPAPTPRPVPAPATRSASTAPAKAGKPKKSWSNIASSLGLEVEPEPEPEIETPAPAAPAASQAESPLGFEIQPEAPTARSSVDPWEALFSGAPLPPPREEVAPRESRAGDDYFDALLEPEGRTGRQAVPHWDQQEEKPAQERPQREFRAERPPPRSERPQPERPQAERPQVERPAADRGAGERLPERSAERGYGERGSSDRSAGERGTGERGSEQGEGRGRRRRRGGRGRRPEGREVGPPAESHLEPHEPEAHFDLPHHDDEPETFSAIGAPLEREPIDRDLGDVPRGERTEGDEERRPRRRRRRGGRGRRREGGETPTRAAEAATEFDRERDDPVLAERAVREEVDEPHDLDDDGMGEEGDHHKRIPTWLEAIDILIATNMVNHSRSGDRGGRGRGRGRDRDR